MKVSHSRIECYNKCAYQYKLKYVDKLECYFDNDPANPLIIGTALHTGIEENTQKAIEWYYNQYPIIDDKNVEEAIKLEHVIELCKRILPPGGQFELKLESDEFIGFIDYLVPVGENEYDLCDFKYSNAIDRYKQSGQLHEYKYYFEKLNPSKRIRNLYFLFAPKVAIKMKYKNKTNPRDETLAEFRKRLQNELKSKEATLVQIEYDQTKIQEFEESVERLSHETEFEKTVTKLCDWCPYKKYCYSDGKETLDIMNLPENTRRNIQTSDKKKIWLYGAPFSGKTYLANKFPNVLMLNTDGNIKYVDAPFVAIKDEVKVEGRVTRKTLAWEVFKDTIAELEKNQNSFETIVVDLLEDLYEYCRLYEYDKLNITHESDDGFRAWDIVSTEFLSTIKRLMNLDYNIVVISHEDTSKDITKKGGDKITAIKPNIRDKVALKVAGMVDLVARIINDEGNRIVSFKNNEVIFGGGRLSITANEIPCEYNALSRVYAEALGNVVKEEQPTPAPTPAPVETTAAQPVAETPETPLPTRKVRTEPTEHEKKVEEFKQENAPAETPAESQPVRRTRRVTQ